VLTSRCADRARGIRVSRRPTGTTPAAKGTMTTQKRDGSWPLIGLLLGALAGALWGWLGSGGIEAGDSALGTGLMGAIAGALIGAVASLISGRRRHSGRD
jgi:membrane associated rhomboid family serine protease